MQTIKPIRNEADYDLALQAIDQCLDAPAGSPERDRLEVLSVLVDYYETNYHAISLPDPVASIEFVLEQRGLARKDLENIIGSSGRVSEVLNKRRALTLPMIRRLVSMLEIPADILIRDCAKSTVTTGRSRVTSRGQSIVVPPSSRTKARPTV